MEAAWVNGLIGGILIGLSATLLLWLNGRIAGISGIFNRAITFQKAEQWNWWFLAGLVGGGALYEYGLAPQPTPSGPFIPVTMAIAGVLVGFGTRLGNGCTSGHGVCGLGRLSGRSLAAVLTFMTTAAITVFITRHVLGG